MLSLDSDGHDPLGFVIIDGMHWVDGSKFIPSCCKHLLSACCIPDTVHKDGVIPKSVSLARLAATVRTFVGR